MAAPPLARKQAKPAVTASGNMRMLILPLEMVQKIASAAAVNVTAGADSRYLPAR
jgi:hypothetical protein